MYSLLILTCLAFIGVSRANPLSKCVPLEKGFHYVTPCRKYAGRTKINIAKIAATQGTPPTSIDQRGGLDLTQALNLAFNVTYNGKPIKMHRMDWVLKMYMPDETGKCSWQEVGTGDATSDLDACQLIKNVDCSYKDKPNYVVAKIDFNEMFGEGISGMEPGAYYGFDVVERDGNEPLNCYWMQSKILKS